MRRIWPKRTALAIIFASGIAVIAIVGVMDGTTLIAQTTNQTKEEAVVTKRARVSALLTNDQSDVDGLKLDNGDRVHFPPHMGEKIAAIARIGDAVEVKGRPKVTPKGEQVFEISRITAGTETVRIVPPDPKPGSKAPHDEKSVSTDGKVTDYASNPHGEVDGLRLSDGTIVKFPPHQSRELQELVRVGDEVRIYGRRHVTPHGEVHLHADVIHANGQSIDREGPKHGPKPPKHGTRAEELEQSTSVEILKELREIRKLLSERR